MRKKLAKYKQEEIEALHYNNPDLKGLEEMVTQYNPRIYERDINDDDFLTINVGLANDKYSYQVTLDYDVLQTEKDELLDEAKKYIMNIKLLKISLF